MLHAITQKGTHLHIDDRNELYRGGEGRILLLDELPNMVVKLYLDPNKAMSAAQFDALQSLDPHYFVAPIELVFDAAPPSSAQLRSILGFTMPYLDDTEHIPLNALFSPAYCQRHQIDYGRKIGIIRQMSAALAAVHAQNICIGDLSGLNTLINRRTDAVRFIDTDSYQTLAHPHSGVLLDDIRDYLYGGKICPESDCFALAVLAFQLLAHTHPFRGIHRKYASLSERIIRRLPVFITDNDLTPPKCYTPLQAPSLQQQFEAIFVQGSRHHLSLSDADVSCQHKTASNSKQAISPLSLPTNSTISGNSGQLRWQTAFPLAVDELVLGVFALPRRLAIRTNQRYCVFDASNSGVLRLTHQIDSSDYDQFYIGNTQIVALKADQLYAINDRQAATSLDNVSGVGAQRCIAQYGNMLAMVGDQYLRQLYLDDLNGNFIRMTQTPVAGKAFRASDTAIWQSVGGQYCLFYRSGEHLSSAWCDAKLRNLYLAEQHGIAAIAHLHQGTEQLRYVFGSLHHLHWQSSAIEATQLSAVAYRPIQKGHGWLFEPADNTLILRRTEDFAVLQTAPCPILSTQTQLYYTEAGIVAWEGNEVWLINTMR